MENPYKITKVFFYYVLNAELFSIFMFQITALENERGKLNTFV